MNLENLYKRINSFSSEKTKKFMGIQLFLILAIILMLYPFVSGAHESMIAFLVPLSLAMFLIPINTYIYERGFVKTSVISLFSAFVIPAATFILIRQSSSTSIAGVFLLFGVIGVSLLLGYLMPPIVLIVHYLKGRWKS